MRKRRIIIAISVLLFIFLLTYGWLAFRDHKSYKNALPADAHLIIKLDVDKLIRKGIFYKITHPSNIFSKKSETGEKVDRPKNGLSIPANIFFFAKKNDPDRIYVTLPVEDQDKAAAFLKRSLNIKDFSNENGNWLGHTPDEKSEVIINNDRILISYSTKKQLQKDGISNLMNSLMAQTPDENLIASLGNTHGDVSALFEGLEVNISAEGNAIKVTGQSSNLDIRSVDIPLLGQFLQNNWNNDLEKLFNGSYQIQLQLKGVVQRTDTITTYEFNDDFEKIEQTALETYPVPGISLYLKTDSLAKNQKAVSLLNKNGLKLTANELSVLHFSNTNAVSPSFSDSDYVFRLEVDFESFVPEINTLKNLKYMNKIKSLELIVTESEEGVYVYESNLVLKENVIGLLLDNI